jgi:protease secretion system outer membrane protein
VLLFAGGYVSAQVRQAHAALTEAELCHETVRRKLAARVRKEYQGVREGIERVRALETAVRSAEMTVLSNTKGLQAGSRSRSDLLNAEESRSNARIELLREQFSVILARARLLSLANPLDHEINCWLAE